MDKVDFQKVWNQVKPVATKKVNGKWQMQASCELISHCGGFQLVLKPDCLMWADELMLLSSVASMFGCSIEFHFNVGLIVIR